MKGGLVTRCFNPTQVRLRPALLADDSFFRKSFNPTQVRLRRRAYHFTGAHIFCFNPTQVRLRQKTGRRKDSAAAVSIPHRYDYDRTPSSPPAWNITVSIPHRYDYDLIALMTFPFESSVSIPHRYDYDFTIVQLFVSLSCAFQSHTGTITTERPAPAPAATASVSIPHRYDYDLVFKLFQFFL